MKAILFFLAILAAGPAVAADHWWAIDLIHSNRESNPCTNIPATITPQQYIDWVKEQPTVKSVDVKPEVRFTDWKLIDIYADTGNGVARIPLIYGSMEMCIKQAAAFQMIEQQRSATAKKQERTDNSGNRPPSPLTTDSLQKWAIGKTYAQIKAAFGNPESASQIDYKTTSWLYSRDELKVLEPMSGTYIGAVTFHIAKFNNRVFEIYFW